MIFVVDNGRDYSDHDLYFVDVPTDRRAEAEALVAHIHDRGYGPPEDRVRVVGIFDVIEWRDPKAVTPFDEFAKDARWRWGEAFEEEETPVGDARMSPGAVAQAEPIHHAATFAYDAPTTCGRTAQPKPATDVWANVTCPACLQRGKLAAARAALARKEGVFSWLGLVHATGTTLLEDDEDHDDERTRP